METWVDHVMVETVRLDVRSDIYGTADRQFDLVKGHAWWEILVFDGDTGAMTMRLGSDPLDDYSGRLT